MTHTLTHPVTYPNRRINFSVFGQLYYAEAGFAGFTPTNAAHQYNSRDSNGNISTHTAGTSNLLGYMEANNWSFEFSFGDYQGAHPNTTNPGRGMTLKADFVQTYITEIADSYNIKWWIEASNFLEDCGWNFTNYESTYGPWCDSFESAAPSNFQGYSFEIIPQSACEWLSNRTSYAMSNKDMSGDWRMGNPHDGSSLLKRSNGTTATLSERLACLDEVIIEFMYADMPGNWVASIPFIKSNFPNMKWGLNIDTVCNNEQWSGTPLGGSAVDELGGASYWTCSSDTPTCAQEKACCLARIATLYSTLGKKWDAVIWNSFTPPYPYNNGIPDIQWHLAWIDANVVPSYLGSASSATWSQTTTPHGTTASSDPEVVSSSSGATWSQTTTPHCTTAGSDPSPPVVTATSAAWTATKVPTCTTASKAPTIPTPPGVLKVIRSHIH